MDVVGPSFALCYQGSRIERPNENVQGFYEFFGYRTITII